MLFTPLSFYFKKTAAAGSFNNSGFSPDRLLCFDFARLLSICLLVSNTNKGGKDNLKDVPYAAKPTTSETDKWRYWRVLLQDGSKVNVHVNQKAAGKVQIGVNHEKLNDSDAVDKWKVF